jgi:parallel beta-helix repeat protein
MNNYNVHRNDNLIFHELNEQTGFKLKLADVKNINNQDGKNLVPIKEGNSEIRTAFWGDGARIILDRTLDNNIVSSRNEDILIDLFQYAESAYSSGMSVIVLAPNGHFDTAKLFFNNPIFSYSEYITLGLFMLGQRAPVLSMEQHEEYLGIYEQVIELIEKKKRGTNVKRDYLAKFNFYDIFNGNAFSKYDSSLKKLDKKYPLKNLFQRYCKSKNLGLDEIDKKWKVFDDKVLRFFKKENQLYCERFLVFLGLPQNKNETDFQNYLSKFESTRKNGLRIYHQLPNITSNHWIQQFNDLNRSMNDALSSFGRNSSIAQNKRVEEKAPPNEYCTKIIVNTGEIIDKVDIRYKKYNSQAREWERVSTKRRNENFEAIITRLEKNDYIEYFIEAWDSDKKHYMEKNNGFFFSSADLWRMPEQDFKLDDIKDQKNLKKDFGFICQTNEDLLDYCRKNGLEGTGSTQDPIIIKDLLIEGDKSHGGMLLKDISLNVILKNINCNSCYYGIKLIHVKNINIINCTFDQCEYSIVGQMCMDTKISNNTFTNCRVGLSLDYCKDCEIQDNRYTNVDKPSDLTRS